MSDKARRPEHVDAKTGLPVREEPPPAGPGRPERIEQARRVATEAAKSLAGDKCTDVVVLDVVDKSEVTDCLVIATGTSQRQMRSAAKGAAEVAESLGAPVYRSNIGEKETDWIVLDCVDVVVHVFMPETRRYYDLEMMWADSPRLLWLNPGDEAGGSAPAAHPERNRAGLRPDDILPRRPSAG